MKFVITTPPQVFWYWIEIDSRATRESGSERHFCC